MQPSAEFKINTYQDVIDLKDKKLFFDKIIINTRKIKYQNILRFAFKYSLHALKLNGQLVVVDEIGPFLGTDRHFFWSKYRISFWQVKQELFKSTKNYMKVMNIDESNATISLKKIKSYSEFNGITFGLLFSGSDKEFLLLQETISRIKKMNFNEIDYEIIVSGPSDFKDKCLAAAKVTYIEYNETNKQFMVGRKKNIIFKNSKYNMIVISHLRIQLNDSILKLFSRNFDFVTTRVIHKKNNNIYPYLDYILTGSYNVNNKKLSNNFVKKDFKYYLKNFKNKVPYIDGGLNIFNKNIIKDPPYSNELAWAEAEDLELSARLFYEGFLIDYHDDIMSESLTDKITVNKNIFQKIITELRDMFL